MLALTFQVGHNRLALDVRQISEVAPRVPLERPTDSPDWLAGILIYRGSIVRVIDLHRLLGAGECPWQLSSRIIVVSDGHQQRRGWLGLLAANVNELKEISATLRSSSSTPGQESDLGTLLNDGGEVLRVVDLDSLLPMAVHEYLARGNAA